MPKKKKQNNIFMYGLSCLALYSIVAVIISMLPFRLNEDRFMMQMSGYALIFNFFASTYIQNILLYLFKKKDKYSIDEGHLFENIFNCVCALFSSAVLYFLLGIRNLGTELTQIITVLYFILSWGIIYIGNKQNRSSEVIYILSRKKEQGLSKYKYMITPLIFSLLWAILVIIVSVLFSEQLRQPELTNKSIAVLVLPHLYALLISVIYSKVNVRLSLKSRDFDKMGNSETGRMYYELFLYIFFCFYFVTTVFIRKNFSNVDAASSEMLLASSFLITIMPYMLIKWLSFDGYSYNGKIPKIKKYTATTWRYGKLSETTIRDEDGNETKINNIDIKL